jgi:hypothetical protein
MGRQTHRPAKEIEKAKRISGKAGERVAKEVRSGQTAQRDIRGSVDVHAYRHAKEAKQQTPLFAMFGKAIADSISRIAKDDALAEKLTDIENALGSITLQEDRQTVKRIAFECESASERFDKWRTIFANAETEVVKLKAVE